MDELLEMIDAALIEIHLAEELHQLDEIEKELTEEVIKLEGLIL